MKNIIIFGATGNTGSYLTLYLNENLSKLGFNIIASGRRDTNFFAKHSIDYYSVDITNKNSFDLLPKENIHSIINLAGILPAYMQNYSPDKYISINTIGTLNILEYAKNVKADRILYSQTFFDNFLSVNQEESLKPVITRNFMFRGDHAVYVISKNAAVDLIEHYYQEYGLKNFIFRLPNIYQYVEDKFFYCDGIKKQRLLTVLVDRAINSEPIEIWGNKDYKKDMVYIADYCQMILKAILCKKDKGFYNVGTGSPVTLEEQIKTIINVFSPKNNPSKIIYRPDLKGGFGVCMDISNAIEELGYMPDYDCKKLFEAYKLEMNLNRFKGL